MATSGSSRPNTPLEETEVDPRSTRKRMVSGSIRKCDDCKKTSDVIMVKWYCRSCELFLCCNCTYHISDERGIHEGETFGEAAKAFCEEFRKKMEDILMELCEFHDAYTTYRSYLEGVSKNKNKTDFHKETVRVQDALKDVEACITKVKCLREEVKEVYNQRYAFGIVQNIIKWELELNDIDGASPGPLTSRIQVKQDGSMITIHPCVSGISVCDRLDSGTYASSEFENIRRAWMKHAGELFLYKKGDFEFWNKYPLSQIRPFVTEGENGEVLVFLMQISGFCGQWAAFDDEVSGTPAGYSNNDARYGCTLSLDKEKNMLIVTQNNHMVKRLPLPGDEYDSSSVMLCVDNDRDMMCVISHDKTYCQDNIFVFKLLYAYDADAASAYVHSNSEADESASESSGNCFIV